MAQLYQYVLAVIMLVFAVPIGDLLAKITKEELRLGKKWFKILVVSSLMLSILFLFIGKQDLFFTLLFIAIMTSRSLETKRIRKNK